MLRSRSSIIAAATSRFRTSADKSNDIRRGVDVGRWRAHLNDDGDSTAHMTSSSDEAFVFGVGRFDDDVVPPASAHVPGLHLLKRKKLANA